MQDIRAFGRIPKEVRGSSEAQLQERRLAERLRRAKQAGLLSAAQKSELADLNAEVKTSGSANTAGDEVKTLAQAKEIGVGASLLV